MTLSTPLKKRDTKRTQILNWLGLVKYANPTNFYYNRANTRDAIYNASKIFNALEKDNLIQRVQFNEDRPVRKFEQFYSLTRKGARSIDFENEYKYVEIKSIFNLNHESSKIDIATSFLKLYPNWEIHFDYNAIICGVRPDIIIRMTNNVTGGFYSFIVEVERKKYPARIMEKIEKYKEVFDDIDFEKNNLSPKTKLLIVFNNLRFSPFWRPTDYQDPEVKRIITMVNSQFNQVLQLSRDLSMKYYRFLPFHEFYMLNKQVWSMPNGQKTSLIVDKNVT